MDPAFWTDRWQRGDIGFHQPSAHDLLCKHWPAVGAKAGAQILVPLCGKSVDMVWLADHGASVLGVELAERAADEFFAERSRTPGVERAGSFEVKRAGPYEIWCGDFLAFPAEAARRVGAIYDRAALVAMPRIEQQVYADKLAELAPTGVPVLLITLDYDPSEMEGPPFPVPRAHVARLFESAFSVRLLEARDGLAMSENLKKRGLTHLEECAFLLRRR